MFEQMLSKINTGKGMVEPMEEGSQSKSGVELSQINQASLW